MRASVLVCSALLGLLLVAGCLGGGGNGDDEQDADDYGPGFTYAFLDANGLPVPSLLCQPMLEGKQELNITTKRCNFDMTPDPGRQGNEVTIAVNPKDPRNVVGGAKDYYPDDAGECVWDGVYVTHDGAASEYEDRSFDGSPWRLLADPTSFEPNYASQFWCTTDPVAYFDVNGNFYYLLMAYQADRVTGSKTCEDICPTGALNDWAFNRATQIVAVSDDGGDTFHTFTPVLEGTFPISFHDKGWVAASPDGTIHVLWLASLLPGNLYFRSTDGGQTYSDPEIMSFVVAAPGEPNVPLPDPLPGVGLGDSGQGSFLDVGTGDQVYAMWTSGGDIKLRRSFDTGSSFDGARTILTVNGAQHPGLSPRDRITGFPGLATDRNPDSPFADALYVVWHDSCNEKTWSSGCDSGASGIYVAGSNDLGETWSEPVRVSGGAEEWRLLPALSVSPGGVLDVSWMEFTDKKIAGAGDVPDHTGITQMYSYSLDGGKTWSVPGEIRDAGDGGWDPALSHHQNGMIFIGDYNDIDSSWQAAHPVWPDTRDGVAVKVYTATVQRPMFADGWDSDKRADAVEFILEHPLT